MSTFDVIGMLGALSIVGAYLLLQLERLDARGLAYSASNALGAALILVSLCFDFNLGAALVEIFWLAISLLGLYRYGQRKRQRTE